MQVAIEASHTDLLELLIIALPVLPFEARKDAAAIFGSVARMHIGEGEDESCPGSEYLLKRNDLLERLVDG